MRMYPRTSAILVATLVASCAVAKNPGGGNGADARREVDPDAEVIGGRPDADLTAPDAAPHPDAMPVPDAMPLPDAPPGSMTLTETTSGAITNDNSIACYQRENSYYRAFQLSDYGITGAFHVTRVDFGVEIAQSNGGSQSVTVKVYSYTGAIGGVDLDTTAMTLLGSTTVSVPNINSVDPFDGTEDGSGQVLTANVTGTVPAGGKLVAEVFVPDGSASGNFFYPGSNAAGESKPGYIRAPNCSTPTPKSFASIGGSATVDLVLSVTGTY
jgi:hypothetical protein